MSQPTDIETKLRGENPENPTVVDQLRLYSALPDTFQFEPDDAVELDELILEAADTIAALRKQVSDAVGEWRPIETAPKDGRTRILIIGHRGEHPDIAVWGNGRFLGKRKGYKQGWTTHPGYTVDPAHWMPLPPLATLTGGKADA